MSSRNLVRQTLEFAAPARAPRQTWTIRWTEQNHPAEIAAIQARFPDDVTWSRSGWMR